MTQLIVNIEDVSLVDELKAAIKALRGVNSIIEMSETTTSNYDITQTDAYKEAMEDIRSGRIHHAESTDDMFMQILGYVPN